MLDDKTKKKLRKIVFKYLDPNLYRVFVFGSRASGKAAKYSDIDLGIESDKEVPSSLISMIKEDFENSDLPYKVDVVDFARTSDKFRKIAIQKVLLLS